ncbi:MAG TPA: hypothetical protein VEA99_21335 [Gemmatimonadaceae bacterium]|nr:hypothetical protein [Gemmatimonadaceae bacterium]
MIARGPLILLALALVPALAAAQQRDTAVTRPPVAARVQPTLQPNLTPNRDVILEVPELSVDSIGLTVSNLRAHVALDANAMNLVQVTAGVDVGIRQVQLGLVGVFAEAYLYVDLDNVARIVARVVQTLDRNPQILTQVLRTVDTTVNAATQGTTPPRRP